MSPRVLVVGLCLSVQLAWVIPVFAYQSPGAPTGFVNDIAGVVSDGVQAELEKELVAFAASTTNEIVVTTLPTLNGDYIEHVSEQLFKEWGIGQEDTDNGVLLLLAIEDRSLRIEVGYGLEGALPDSVADQIIRSMVPLLKDEDYDAAIQRGVRDIQRAVAGEYEANVGTTVEGMGDLFNMGIAALIFGSFVLQWIGAILARSKSWWAGGVLGLLIGSVVSSTFAWWLFGGALLTIGLTLFGLFFDYVVSSTYSHAKRTNIDPPWWAGGPGSYSGSSSGGGFGGFGGGSSGGGGASGRW
ncbi:MAG: TPM domain-containing protein [Candidatus Pacebacteria bacterium]|nr:TPM domain-containing protein [Candidatus Paceibacterota bacterium]